MSEQAHRLRSPFAAALRAALAALVLLLAACKVQTERETLLPWLLSRTVHMQFGNFPGSAQRLYYTKHWGFWRSVDVWDAAPLDAEHALTRDAEGAGILRKGSIEPVRVCPALGSLSIPPVAGRVDCVQAVAHGASGLTRIRVTRRDFAGAEREVLELEADGERRIVHPSARVFFYDDAGVPFAVLMGVATARDYRHRPIDCAVAFPDASGGTRVLPGPDPPSWEACFRPAFWKGVLERRLHEAGSRPPPLRDAGAAVAGH